MPPSRTFTPPPLQNLPKKPDLTMNSPESPTEISSIPTFTVPSGWTTDRADDFYADWEDTDARGQAVAHAYGLRPGQPIMEDDYGVTQIFLSGNTFYGMR